MPNRISETLQDANEHTESPVTPVGETDTGAENSLGSGGLVDNVQTEIENSNVVASESDDEAFTDPLTTDASAPSDAPAVLEASVVSEEKVVPEGSAMAEGGGAFLQPNESGLPDVSFEPGVPVEPESSEALDQPVQLEGLQDSNVLEVPEVSLEPGAPVEPESLIASDQPVVLENSLESDVPEVIEVSALSEELVVPEDSAMSEATEVPEGYASSEAAEIFEVPVALESPAAPEGSAVAGASFAHEDGSAEPGVPVVSESHSESELPSVPEASAVPILPEEFVDVGTVDNGHDALGTVVVDYELTVEDELESADVDSNVVVSEEIDFNDFNLQVVDVDLFAADDEISLAEAQVVGEGISTEANSGEIYSTEPTDLVAEDATAENESVEKEPVENNENNIVVPASDEGSVEIAVVSASGVVTDSDAEEHVVETVASVSEKPAPKGFIKRWASRVVSWVKRFVGF